MTQVSAGDAGGVATRIVGYASANPLAVAGAVVAVLALALLLWGVYRYLARGPADRFKSVLADYDEVAVLMHPNPDPDAMSAALAVGQLAGAVDTRTVMYYPGEIRRPENRAFQTVLDLEFRHVDTAEDIREDDVVLVDHNEPRGFPNSGVVDPVAIVDHHPGGGTGRRFTDIRPDTGACATVLAEYFEDLDWSFHEVDAALADGGVDTDDVPPDALPSHVATGMVYGIQSDTRQLTNGCSSADFDAAAYLYEGMDGDLLNRIANPQVDAEVLEVKARAITEREVNGPFAYADVAEVSNTDAIPQAADELETLEGVSAVVVVGECDGTLRLAGRSRDDRVHIGRAIEAVVEDIPMAEGGGHARMGGGQIPVEYMAGIGPSDGTSRDELRERVFQALSGER